MQQQSMFTPTRDPRAVKKLAVLVDDALVDFTADPRPSPLSSRIACGLADLLMEFRAGGARGGVAAGLGSALAELVKAHRLEIQISRTANP